jgi:PAS domain S-box-containing protein
LAGGTVDREVRREAADGLRYFRVQVALRKGADGRPADGYAIYTDITERKKAEQDLQRTTQLLEKTLESLNEAVLVVDPSNREIIMCNTAVRQVFGYEKEALIGENTARLHVDPAAYERFADLSEQALDETGSFAGEYRMRRKDGRVIDTEHVVTPLESGRWPRGVVSVVRDITERKRHERLLRQKERRYEAVFEDPNILVALVDADGTVLNINQTAMSYVDASLEALRGRRFWETPWFAGDEGIQQKMRRWIGQAADGAYVEFEIDHTQALGVPLEVSGVVRPVTDAQGAVTSLLISAREVTERKQHERALVEAKETAEEASRLKSAMLANMSHEIRTPLTSISGFSELLSERLEGEAAQFNERVRRSSRRLMKTLNSVLELSRLEAGMDAFTCESLRLGRVVEKTVELLRPQAEEKGVALNTDRVEEAAGRWNEGAVNRIAENLIENAIKFTPAGGQVAVRVRTEGAVAVLEVEDTGIGISEEALPEIFTAFKQESEGLRREYEGSGLGLSIVERLVDRMQGTIEVDSEKGEGSRFVVRLPRGEGETAL